MSNELITLEIKNKIAEITFQTNQQNTVNATVCTLLQKTLSDLKEDQQVRGVLLKGSNGFFSNGFNPEAFVGQSEANIRKVMDPAFNLCFDVMNHPLPFACCMNGHAMGFGAILALFTDYRYMLEKKGRFGFPEILIGLAVPLAPAIVLQDICGITKTRDIILSGKAMKSSEAFDNGVIDQLFETEELMFEHARKSLSKMFKYPRETVALNKAALNYRYQTILRQAVDEDVNMSPSVISSAVGQEGLTSLKEARRPDFSGFS